MTQIATRNTMDVEEAIDLIIANRKAAIQIGLPDKDGVAYIRAESENSFWVNVYVRVVGDRVNLRVDDPDIIEAAILDANTATLVDKEDTDFAD